MRSGNASYKSALATCRPALAKLLLVPSNFLVLDEPTNHLDMESRAVLLEALQDYTGTLCLVSHDRAFVSPLVDSVLEITPSEGGSRVTQLTSGYEEYLQKKMREAVGTMRMDPSAEKSSPDVSRSGDSGRSDPAPKVRTGPSNNQKTAWERLHIEKFIGGEDVLSIKGK